MDLAFAPAAALRGEVRLPGDKSVTHRAFLVAAIARGTTVVTGANTGADCAATLRAVETLGARVARGASGGVTIEGCPGALRSPTGPLDLGNSGTGMRLLAGLLAGRDVTATLVGDASLSGRPMARIVEPLVAMGADVVAEGADGRPPLAIRGIGPAHLVGRVHTLAVASAQVKSCLLLAGLAAEGRTTAREPSPSRDHSERMLPAFGVPVVREAGGVAVTGPAVPTSPGGLAIPGDFSAAMFWLVAGTIAPAGEIVLREVGMNPTRAAGLDVLLRMGASIRVVDERMVGGEPVADLVVRPARLRASDVGAEEVPRLVDELPALAVAQALAEGVSRVRGAAELRVKESNRISAVVNGLQALGGKAVERADGWDIEGGALQGGTVESHGDHRIAMAFGVAGLAAEGVVTVRESEMIDTSYPRFYIELRDRVTSR
jgi:3-phosphoshikimate 1-carboxyvinyltransferase